MNKMPKVLLGGSLALLILFNIFNVLNFLFHFVMVRMLTIADYGVLATLFSIIYLLAIFSDSIQTVVTRYVAHENNDGKIKNLLKRTLSKSGRVSVLLFVAYLILSIPLSIFLKISYPLLALNGVMLITYFLVPITRGALQGKNKFYSLGANMVLEALVKLFISMFLVYMGWRVYGAIFATVLGSVIAFSWSFVTLKKIFSSKEMRMEIKGIYSYTPQVFIMIFTVTAFFSLDIIIAKMVFSSEIAGYYAVASIISKSIFLVTQPISKAMFPLTVQSSDKKKVHSKIFYNSLALLVPFIAIALFLFYFYPETIVKIFSGREILQSAGILFLLGIANGILSITNIFLFYRLSVGKKKGHSYFLIFLLVEAVLLFYFSKNLFQFSVALVTASAIFLWGAVFLLEK
ncbi:MAG: oligosaccharide flippase family protein [Nanoarchaeota archaeon]|nr:oligosaccharide flippase family protein [Nanoarchaeota archaeon]